MLVMVCSCTNNISFIFQLIKRISIRDEIFFIAKENATAASKILHLFCHENLLMSPHDNHGTADTKVL